MLLQLPWKEFLLVIVCVNCFLIPYTACKAVRCEGNEVNNGECHCREIERDETPWPRKENSPTAPKPRNASMKMKMFHGKLNPKLRWTLNRHFITNVDGFYLEVWLWPNYYDYYYCVHNSSLILKNSHHRLLVAYEFQGCCQSLLGDFADGDELYLKVHSLPMYDADETTHFASASLTVEVKQAKVGNTTPEPEPEDFGKTEKYHNKLKEFQDKLDSFENKLLQKDDASINVLTVIVAVLITIIVCAFGACLLVAYFRRKPRNLLNARTRHVLLIGDEDEYCIKLVNGFIETLKKLSSASVDVVSNIRKTSEIASSGIVTWTTENFCQADVVVMLINDPTQVKAAFATEQDNEDLKKSPVNVALNVAESQAVKSSFGICKKKFVVVHSHSSKTKSLVFCTHYILKKHCKEILKHVLGDLYDSSVDVKKDCEQLLKIGKENDDVGATKCRDVRRKTTNPRINNLDVSLSPNQIELEPQVNDFSMSNHDPSSNFSVENNERVV